jgi:hypothetical protein
MENIKSRKEKQRLKGKKGEREPCKMSAKAVASFFVKYQLAGE